MKSIFYIISTCILLTTITSCNKDNDNEIEAELQFHFDSFVTEAFEHGMDISLEDLDIGGYIENIQESGTLGQCKTYSNGSKQVVIDLPYWNSADEIEREYIVFHELGHCLLGREHKDDKDSEGDCVSIMQSGDSGCDGVYDLENRNELIDELFRK